MKNNFEEIEKEYIHENLQKVKKFLYYLKLFLNLDPLLRSTPL